MDKYTEHDFRRLTPRLSLLTASVVPQLHCPFSFFSAIKKVSFFFSNTLVRAVDKTPIFLF
jgi:hypothetical protein